VRQTRRRYGGCPTDHRSGVRQAGCSYAAATAPREWAGVGELRSPTPAHSLSTWSSLTRSCSEGLPLKIAVIVPAYNEAPRLAAVLEALAVLPSDWEVLVVSDGSCDGTAGAARAHGGVRVLELPENLGKGAAIQAGARAAGAELVVLLDGDLRGLRPGHVQALVEPVLAGKADMAVALFRGGRGSTDFSHRITPWVSGQRALRRSDLLSLPRMAEVRHGVEALLTRTARARRWRVHYVRWEGVTHSMKEEKLGPVRGHRERWRMYLEMLRTWLRARELGS